MKKNAINNNTTIFSGVGAFLAFAVMRIAEAVNSEFIDTMISGYEVEWTAGLVLLFAWLGRQAKHLTTKE